MSEYQRVMHDIYPGEDFEEEIVASEDTQILEGGIADQTHD